MKQESESFSLFHLFGQHADPTPGVLFSLDMSQKKKTIPCSGFQEARTFRGTFVKKLQLNHSST